MIARGKVFRKFVSPNFICLLLSTRNVEEPNNKARIAAGFVHKETTLLLDFNAGDFLFRFLGFRKGDFQYTVFEGGLNLITLHLGRKT